MEEKHITNALSFSNLLENANRDSFRELLKLIVDFSKIYDVEKAKLPYHINLIDELHADENAHSRIFAKLLRYTENNKYPFLEKFLKDVCKFDINIEEPTIEKVDSCGRIDIPILDKKYFVIIENKVTDKAPDQNIEEGGQLARYIENVRNNYNKEEEEIYVVYTPRDTREPSDESWISKDNFSYKDDFKNRFVSLSYRDEIYPWLKNNILDVIEKENRYLISAVEQYVDHLEGMFSLRKINKKMNIKLQKFIKQELGLQDDKPEEATEILNDKEEELDNTINQIRLLKSEYHKQIIVNKFKQWKKLLESDFPSLKIVGDESINAEDYIIIGVNLLIKKKKITALIEYDVSDESICYGLGVHHADERIKVNPSILKSIIEQYELEDQNEYWYGWKETSLENSYSLLKTLIKEFRQDV